MDITAHRMRADTESVLNREWSREILLEGMWNHRTPIFDRLAADYFAKEGVDND